MGNKKRFKEEWSGDIAAVLGIFALLPIAWYVSSTGYVRDVSLSWLILKLTASSLWLYYGWVNENTPTVIGAMSTGLILMFLVVMKIFLEK